MTLPERRPTAELRLLDQVAGHQAIQTYIALADQFTGQLGFLQRTPRGRVATAAAFAHLGVEEPRGTGAAPAPGSLFEGHPE